MTTTRGSRPEVERMDGDTLLFTDGTWYRADNDFDHGWCYQYPSMPHTKVRRNGLETFRARGFYLLMMTLWVVGIPAIAWSTVTDSPWWLLYAVPMTVAMWWCAKNFHRDLFKFMWHGYLTLR